MVKFGSMKRFNARFPVVLALSVCAGIFTSVILFLYRLNAAWIALSVAPCALILPVWALISKKIFKPALFVLLPLASFVSSAVNCYFTLNRYDNSEIQPDTNYYIQGRVIEKGITSYGEYAVLGNVKLDSRNIDGKMYVFLSSAYGEFCDIGYTVEFYGVPEAESVFEYGKLNNYTEENIKYTVSVYGGLSSTYRFSFLGQIRTSLRDKLFGNLSRETAAVTFGMLTGNTQYVGEQTLQSFRYGGIAHIFAVSGLHVGIIFTALTFLCKKLRLNKYLSSIICLAFISFYVALCGFTLSSVRAAIMCAVAAFAGLSIQKFDGLNALSVAVLIILFITPLSLFSVGFQLTVCATGGIFALSKIYTEFLRKLKFPRKIRSATGYSLGAQTAILPVLLANFGYVSGAGLILNIIVIPVLSFVFTLLFAASFISVIIPPAQLILPYAALPLELFMSVILGLGFEKSLISGFGAGLFVPLYFIGALFLSDKINLKLLTRVAATGIAAVILASYVLAKYGYPYRGFNVIVSAYGRGGEVIIKSEHGTLLIVTENVNAARLKNTFFENYITDIDVLVILGEGDENLLGLEIDCREIRLNASLMPVQPYSDRILIYESEFTACGVKCKFFDDRTLLVNVGGVNMGICSESNFALPDCDILVTDEKNAFINCREEIYFNNPYGELNVFERGNITLKAENGDFSIKTAMPPR